MKSEETKEQDRDESGRVIKLADAAKTKTGTDIIAPGGGGRIGKTLSEEILRLESEERLALVDLLRGMWEPDINRMLSSGMVNWWLKLTRLNVKIDKEEQEAIKRRQEERIYRNGLPRLEKVDYVVNQLTEQLQMYAPAFLREVLGCVLGGEKGPADWKKSKDGKAYLIGKANHVFEGCDQSLRQAVVEKYLDDVMPDIEDEFEKEEDRQNALDDFVELIQDKTPEETQDLIAKIKAELL